MGQNDFRSKTVSRDVYMACAYVLIYGHIPDNKVHGVIMGPIWSRQDPGGPHELCYLGSYKRVISLVLCVKSFDLHIPGIDQIYAYQ